VDPDAGVEREAVEEGAVPAVPKLVGEPLPPVHLSEAAELEQTTEVLGRVTLEYQAGLQALAPQVADHRIDLAHYNAVVLKLFEKKMYEARLKAAQART
jgi:hypothetical protein